MAEIKLYLPKTADNYQDAYDHVTEHLAGLYGGFTVYGVDHDSVIGGWVNDGEVIEEPVAVIEGVGETARKGEAYALAADVRDITGESAVLAVIDGEKVMAD